MPSCRARFVPCLLFLALLLPAQPSASSTNPRLSEVLNELENTRSFSQLSISPNGQFVAWVSKVSDNSSTLHVLAWKKPAARARAVTFDDPLAAQHPSNIAWAADSRRFVFLSHGDSPQDQVYLATPENLRARRLSTLDGYVTALRWSPSGQQLAFLYAEHGGGGGPLGAVPAQIGVIGSDLHNQRLTLMSIAGADLHPLTPADLNIYEYDWSPDGSRFAAIAAPGPADNNWWTAKLYTVPLAGGAMKLVFTPPVQLQLATPHWSPDSSQLAFLGGIMSDQGFNGGDIFLLPAAGGEPRNLTSARKSTATGFSWRNKDTLLLTEAVDGGGALSTLRLADGQSETLWRGGQSLHIEGNYPNMSLAADGVTSAIVRSTWDHPPEIAAGRLGDWNNVTSENSTQKPQWGKAESVTWENENFHSQGWLLYPANFDPAKRYGLIVSIHGGPSGFHAAAWPSAHFDMSVMAALGYFVFFPNPRGSYGGGESFTRANAKDFGGGDLRDVLAGLDSVLAKAPIDPARVGVTGWSYGGYMTMWTVTQTNRFHAAVAGAGIANWLSYYGENSIDQWMIPFFGASVYDDPGVYAKSSPITYIKQVKTPTLVVVGERDGECPAPQSFEFWHALHALNVPTELVVYAGEGHAFRESKNRLDVIRRTADWFSQYLK